MEPVFTDRSGAEKVSLGEVQTFRAFLAQHSLDGEWENVALYNWATKNKAAIKRAPVEFLGCKELKPDPLDCVLDPGRAINKDLYKPKLWVPEEPLLLEKTHSIKLKKRLPTPAVSITKLTRWFLPKPDEECEIEYLLEGAKERAAKVDFEVHTKHYYKLTQREDSTEVWGSRESCDTQATVSGSTHIFQRRKLFELSDPVAPDTSKSAPSWDGTCSTDQGVLKTPQVINYGCAPYIVLLRFYKDEADKDAKILLHNFHPYWKQPASGSSTLELDDSSVVVKWEISDDNGKLTIGQLQVWNNEDKLVFFAALGKDILQPTGSKTVEFDLGTAWGKTEFKRDEMPYRVQIQAHSDEGEANGLALAVMHTEVKPQVYTEARMIGFDIMPSGTYKGKADDDLDIKERCEIMITAIQEAYKKVKADKESVMKVFMAPEFYFRGLKGGYQIIKDTDDPKQSNWNLTSIIMETLRAETDKFKYADWLFVFGTAIGYLPHSVGSSSIEHEGPFQINAEIIEVVETGKKYKLKMKHCETFCDLVSKGVECKIGPKASASERVIIKSALFDTDDKCEIELKADKVFDAGPTPVFVPIVWVLSDTPPKVRVASMICERIPETVGDFGWTLDKGASKKVNKSEPVGGSKHIYDLTLDNHTSAAYSTGPAKLIEFKSTEVFNIALVKKGWPAKMHAFENLEEAIIYKEYVSSIDYKIPMITCGKTTCGESYKADEEECPHCNEPNPEWWNIKNLHHKIDINGNWTTVIPTYGSQDTLGGNRQVTRKNYSWVDSRGATQTYTAGTEINKTGQGGGSVLTVDGITIG